MRIIKLVVMVAVLVAAFNHFKDRQGQEASEEIATNTFVPVMMPNGAKADMVWIFAPKNCPSSAAQRAKRLSEQLTEMNIPNTITSHYRASAVPIKDDEALKEFEAIAKSTDFVMRGDIPAVIINGKGQSNPTLEEVVAEYQKRESVQ